MEAETALVRTEGGIELDTISTIYLDLVLVVFPDYAELDDSLWDGCDLEGFLVLGVFFEERGVFERGHEF